MPANSTARFQDASSLRDASDVPTDATKASLTRPLAARSWRRFALATAATHALAIFGLVGCGGEPPVFDPNKLEAGERSAAIGKPSGPTLQPYPNEVQRTPTPQNGNGGGTRPSTRAYVDPIPTGRTYSERDTVPLTLREIITRTVLYNSDIRVAGYDPAINASKVLEAESNFDLTYFLNMRTERNDPGLSAAIGSVAANTLVGFNDKTKTNTLETGFQQKLPWGGQAKLLYGLSWNEVDNLPSRNVNGTDPTPFNGSRDSFWQNQIRLEVTQPLLRDFGRDSNAARIEIARGDQRISLLDFRKAVEDQLSEIERAYWQLYQSVKIVEIQENLLADTIETYRVLRERFEKGLDASEIPVSQALSSVKARQADLIRAKAGVRDLSDEIKRRMNDPTFPVSSDLVIFPTEVPLKEPVQFSYDSAIDAASYNRFELGQQRARIEQARIAERVAANNILPRFDLVGRLGTTGLGDTVGESIRNFSDFNSPSWSFGFELEYPIGNRAALSILNRARLQRLQAIEQYRSIQAQVSQDVRASLNDISASWEQAGARAEARLASTRQLSLIQKQQDLGEPITPPFIQVKLQAQEELANNSREEVTSLANYNIAIQRLERAKGTLLKYNNVQLKEDPSQTYLRRSWAASDPTAK